MSVAISKESAAHVQAFLRKTEELSWNVARHLYTKTPSAKERSPTKVTERHVRVYCDVVKKLAKPTYEQAQLVVQWETRLFSKRIADELTAALADGDRVAASAEPTQGTASADSGAATPESKASEAKQHSEGKAAPRRSARVSKKSAGAAV